MREIKFRAKVKYNGNHYYTDSWVYGHYHQNENGQHLIFDNEENYIKDIGDFTRYEDVEIDETTLGQYTGLKDKNGVEIYEGDILQSTYLNEDNEKVTLECLWSKEFIGFEFVDHKRPHIYYCSIEEEFEVIGNIHDKEKGKL